MINKLGNNLFSFFHIHSIQLQTIDKPIDLVFFYSVQCTNLIQINVILLDNTS